MKSKLIIAAAVAALSIPAVSMAAPVRPGAYVSGFLGVSMPKDTTVTAYDYLGNQQIDDRVELDPGIFIGGTGGYDFGYVRLEGELSYKHSEIDSVTDNITPAYYRNTDGDLGVLAYMANVYFDLHNDTPVTPYFGGGIGGASLHLSDTEAADGTLLYYDDDATAFAYQAAAGVEIALNRRLSLDVGYRYFGTDEAEFDRGNQLNGSTAEMKFESHNVAVGLRVKF